MVRHGWALEPCHLWLDACPLRRVGPDILYSREGSILQGSAFRVPSLLSRSATVRYAAFAPYWILPAISPLACRFRSLLHRAVAAQGIRGVAALK